MSDVGGPEPDAGWTVEGFELNDEAEGAMLDKYFRASPIYRPQRALYRVGREPYFSEREQFVNWLAGQGINPRDVREVKVGRWFIRILQYAEPRRIVAGETALERKWRRIR